MLAQTVDDLATIIRSDLDDPIRVGTGDADCLWKDADIYRYMTEAVDAVMNDTGIKNRRIVVPFTADSPYARLPAGVIGVESVAITGGGTLQMVNTNSTAHGALSRPVNIAPTSVSVPTTFTYEDNLKRLTLDPTPAVDGTLDVFATMTIGSPIFAGMPMPVTSVRDQSLVLLYMKSLAYRKHDAETLDLGRSNEYLAMYKEASVDRESEIRKQRRAPGVVRMNW